MWTSCSRSQSHLQTCLIVVWTSGFPFCANLSYIPDQRMVSAGKQEDLVTLATDFGIESSTSIPSWPTNSYIQIQFVNMGWFESRVPQKLLDASFSLFNDHKLGPTPIFKQIYNISLYHYIKVLKRFKICQPSKHGLAWLSVYSCILNFAY